MGDSMGNMGYLTSCLLMAHNVPGTLLATEAIVVNETRYSLLPLWIVHSNAGLMELLVMSDENLNVPSELHGTVGGDTCYGVM